MPQYLETDEGQIVAGALKYISAADELFRSETYADRPTLLQTPILHLLVQGIELLLKGALLRSGAEMSEVKGFGHRVGALWDDARCSTIKQWATEVAVEVWNREAKTGRWPDDFGAVDPVKQIDRAVRDLGHLHAQKGHVLRYTTPPGTMAPKPPFILHTFKPIAEDAVRNPRLLTGG